MNINSLIIKLLCGCLAATLLVGLVGCKNKNTETASSEEAKSEAQSTSSVLLPVEATFDEKYTTLAPAKSGDDVKIKGNVGVNVSADGTKVYDPTTFEAMELQGTYTFVDGPGVGSTCVDFMDFFGIKRGYYTAYDGDYEPVDVTVESEKDFTFIAILKFDEATQKMTYVPGGKVSEHAEGLNSAGISYLSGAEIGNDVLMITLFVNGDLVVSVFDIAHYTI